MSDSLSLPSILIAGVLIFVAFRYFFSPAATAASPSSRTASTRNVDLTKVHQVSQMFPQLDRRSIAWDLSRNGGSVTATTERCLTGVLDNPPPAFQPANLSSPSSSSITRTSTSTGTQQRPAQDLISRFNLSSKLKTQEDAPVDEEPTVSKGWASTKSERAALFVKRREEMILNARKKMEDAARREQKGKGKAID